MQTTVHAKGFDLTAALREHAERHVETAVERIAPEGARATVTLEDVNGPRGGKDKICRIRLLGFGIKADAIEASADDMYVAIDLAAHKLGRWATHATKRAKPAFPDRTRRASIRKRS
jgi:ribosome-associated translation inhibitor RaiA